MSGRGAFVLRHIKSGIICSAEHRKRLFYRYKIIKQNAGNVFFCEKVQIKIILLTFGGERDYNGFNKRRSADTEKPCGK